MVAEGLCQCYIRRMSTGGPHGAAPDRSCLARDTEGRSPCKNCQGCTQGAADPIPIRILMADSDVEQAPSVSVLPRNKILILGPAGKAYQAEVIRDLFNIEASESDRIVRDVKWSNKYYEVDLDLYIDSYESLQTWGAEFCSDECADLRDVVAGIFLVFEETADAETFQQLIEDCHFTDERVLVACDLSSAEHPASLERALEVHDVALVRWRERGTNELGEQQGRDRVRELLDIHPWSERMLRMHASTAAALAELDPLQADIPLDSVVTRIKQARERYLEITDVHAADEYAARIAHELTEQLLPE
ncbi:FAFR248Cp [Eremothecium gossypii FDAG1]|nr:FAFR248Cp [Eremothecium gossypii FDAG1]